MKLFNLGCLIILAIVIPSTLCHATERVVWADVVEVTPLTSKVKAVRPAICTSPKPTNVSDLSTLLRWDMRAECSIRQTRHTTGYDVRYRWDGKSYRAFRDKHPGDRIALSVRFE